MRELYQREVLDKLDLPQEEGVPELGPEHVEEPLLGEGEVESLLEEKLREAPPPVPDGGYNAARFFKDPEVEARDKELVAFKAWTASRFYCSSCRTRDIKRCRCLEACSVCSVPAQRAKDIEEGKPARCAKHLWGGGE